jgi:hypothetical protein
MKLKRPPIQMSSIGTEDSIEPGIISLNNEAEAPYSTYKENPC